MSEPIGAPEPLGSAGPVQHGMRIDVVTIFPEYLEPLNVSLVGKARARGQLDVHVHDLRGWTTDVHRTVDDTPYGGGPGMVMKPEPWAAALDAVVGQGPEGAVPTLVVPTPSGRPFTQELAQELATRPWLAFAPARYEGIDRRVIEEAATRMPVVEASIGDYVLMRRRGGRAGDGGSRRLAAPRSPRQRRVPPGRLLRPRRDGGPPGRPRLHQVGRVAWPGRAGCAAQWQPRQDRPMAA